MNNLSDNGFRPVKGQKVRIVGNCHSRLVGKVARVTDADDDGFTILYQDDKFGFVYTSGVHGGLEPIED